MPASVTLENIKEERYSRNPKLAAALTQYSWVRESNEGVGRIYRERTEYILDAPTYTEPNGSSVQLILKKNILARKEIPISDYFSILNEQEKLLIVQYRPQERDYQ